MRTTVTPIIREIQKKSTAFAALPHAARPFTNKKIYLLRRDYLRAAVGRAAKKERRGENAENG
nr:MAG TPA: hypothetical protein [Caudoviricetes sp.]